MKHDKICTWLGLPAGGWPPDHYALLGLTPGEQDVARIEQHVHDRLAKLRCYQLSNPEQATEAMNRLAQAFMCLTDAEAKKVYDLSSGRNGSRPDAPKEPAVCPAAGETAPPVAADDTAVRPLTQVDWQNSPPPVRNGDEAAPATVLAEAPAANGAVAAPPETAAAPPVPPASQPADLLFESARVSVEARRGIGTLGALVGRIDHTRHLLWSWDQAGRYLNKARRRLSRLADQNDLSRWLEKVGEQMEGFPKILGQPGQPGYRVVAMARLEMTAVMFNMLDPNQREALARDWVAGRVVLLAHRKFLHGEFKRLRRRNILARAIHASRAALNDHPRWVLLGIAAAALAVAGFYLAI